MSNRIPKPEDGHPFECKWGCKKCYAEDARG